MNGLLITGLALSALIIAARAYVAWRFRRMARRILAKARVMVAPLVVNIVRDVRAEFPNANHTFYAEKQAWLEQNGFRLLGDIDIATARVLNPHGHTYIRIFTSDTEPICPGVYAVTFQKLVRIEGVLHRVDQEIKMLEFSSELSEGCAVLTSIDSSAKAIEPRPGLFRHFEPVGTSDAELLDRHRAHLRDALEKRRDLRPIPINTIEEMLARMHETHERKLAYRREIGTLTFEELRRMSPPNMSRRLIERIHHEVVRLESQTPNAPSASPAGSDSKRQLGL